MLGQHFKHHEWMISREELSPKWLIALRVWLIPQGVMVQLLWYHITTRPGPGFLRVGECRHCCDINCQQNVCQISARQQPGSVSQPPQFWIFRESRILLLGLNNYLGSKDWHKFDTTWHVMTSGIMHLHDQCDQVHAMHLMQFEI